MEVKIRKYYDRISTRYDQRWKNYITHTLSFLKTWAAIPPSATVLDVGCGTGEFERLLLSEQTKQCIVGVDISEKMLSIASQKCLAYPYVYFKPASAVALPFENDSFDLIVSANAFHFFPCPETALAEMRRVLKPEGQVFILDWCRDYLICQICDLLLKIFDPSHEQCYTQSELHNFLENAGLRVVRDQRMRFGIWGLMIATATPKYT